MEALNAIGGVTYDTVDTLQKVRLPPATCHLPPTSPPPPTHLPPTTPPPTHPPPHLPTTQVYDFCDARRAGKEPSSAVSLLLALLTLTPPQP